MQFSRAGRGQSRNKQALSIRDYAPMSVVRALIPQALNPRGVNTELVCQIGQREELLLVRASGPLHSFALSRLKQHGRRDQHFEIPHDKQEKLLIGHSEPVYTPTFVSAEQVLTFLNDTLVSESRALKVGFQCSQ